MTIKYFLKDKQFFSETLKRSIVRWSDGVRMGIDFWSRKEVTLIHNYNEGTVLARAYDFARDLEYQVVAEDHDVVKAYGKYGNLVVTSTTTEPDAIANVYNFSSDYALRVVVEKDEIEWFVDDVVVEEKPFKTGDKVRLKPDAESWNLCTIQAITESLYPTSSWIEAELTVVNTLQKAVSLIELIWPGRAGIVVDSRDIMFGGVIGSEDEDEDEDVEMPFLSFPSSWRLQPFAGARGKVGYYIRRREWGPVVKGDDRKVTVSLYCEEWSIGKMCDGAWEGLGRTRVPLANIGELMKKISGALGELD